MQIRFFVSIILFFLLSPSLGWSQEQPYTTADPNLRFREKRIVVLPVRNLQHVHADSLFLSSASAENDTSEALEKSLLEEVKRSLTLDPRFHPFTPKDTLAFFSKKAEYTTGVALVRERYHLGLDYYDDLRLPEATTHLESARSSASALYLEILEPALVARIYLGLGLCYLEQNKLGQAHIAFKKMFFLTPNRKFRKGYYPLSIETALTSALTDTIASTNAPWPLENQYLHGLMSTISARQALFLLVDSKKISLVTTDEMREWRDSEALQENPKEAASRLISRWISCLEGDVAKSRIQNFQPEFRIDSNLSHGLFLEQPTRQYANLVGMAANGTFRFNRYLDGSIKLSFLSMLQDPLYDLRNQGTSFRAVISSGFSFRQETWLWFVRTGLDLHAMDEFTVITNPDCKFFGTQSDRCPDGSATRADKNLLTGLVLLLGASYDLTQEVYLAAQISLSLYSSPSGDKPAFNYLLGNELGLGYRF